VGRSVSLNNAFLRYPVLSLGACAPLGRHFLTAWPTPDGVIQTGLSPAGARRPDARPFSIIDRIAGALAGPWRLCSAAIGSVGRARGHGDQQPDMSSIKASVFTCAWYHVGIRDFHLAIIREHADRDIVSIVRITDDRSREGIQAENAHFGAGRTYVFRSKGALLRNLTKLLPIFPIYVFAIMAWERRRGQLLTHDGFCFWSVPGIFLRRAQLFAHDPKAHESAERAAAAASRRRYFHHVYFRKRWGAIVVGSDSNHDTMLDGKCASPVIVVPFPHFDTDLFDGVADISELAGVKDCVLFFSRVDVYKGVYEWLRDNPETLASRPLEIAGEMIDERVHEFSDRIILIGRLIKPEEDPHLFGGAATLICPYLSATHSGIPDLGVSFGAPGQVSRIPYFEERYGAAPGVTFINRPADAAR
jgi:glycosyltransferase involved in cell wall biosynthesis